jgi:hypothetical protein
VAGCELEEALTAVEIVAGPEAGALVESDDGVDVSAGGTLTGTV